MNRLLRIGWLAVWVLGAGLPTVQAASDPGGVFLSAFQDFQSAEKLEREAKPKEALERYRVAEKSLRGLMQSYPDWQPLVVEYRLKKTQEGIVRVEADASRPMPRGRTDALEGDLPASDRSPATVTDRVPSPSVEDPSADAGVVYDSGTASSGGSLGRQLGKARKDLDAAKARNEKLTDQVSKLRAEIQSAMLEVDKRRVDVVELKATIAQLSDQLENSKKDSSTTDSAVRKAQQQAAASYKQLRQIQAERDAALEENEMLLAKLETAAKYIEGSDTQREKLTAERDEAVQKAKRAKDSKAEVERLAKENATLKDDVQESQSRAAKVEAERDALVAKLKKVKDTTVALEKLTQEKDKIAEKLAQTEKQVAEAQATGSQSDGEVQRLRSELNTVRDELLAAQILTQQRDGRVSDLEKQLDQATGELASIKLNGPPSTESSALQNENDLLRAIVMRQLKEAGVVEKTRISMQEEIERMQVRSEALDKSLADLAAARVELTDQEKQLFREPVIALTEGGGEQIEAAVVVAKPSGSPGSASDSSPASSTIPDGTELAVKPAPAPDEPLPAELAEDVKLAKTLFAEEKFEDSEKLYQKIVSVAPKNYYALTNLAVTQFRLGRLTAAEVALRKAVAVNPNRSDAYTILGIVHYRQGRYDDGVIVLRRAVELNDADAAAHNYLGITLSEKGDTDAAVKEIERAIALNSQFADAHFNLAVIYATSKAPSKELAKEHYTKAKALGAPPDASLERLIQ